MSNAPPKPKLLVIVGPTASGKTALSIDLARRFDGEIISADSRQVYRGMDIGSGKVTKREMRGVPHHLLDVASPTKTFTAAQYQKKGKKIIKEILQRGKLPIVVGGTGFYIDSLLYNYSLPEVKPHAALRRGLEKRSGGDLFRELARRDPRRAASIDRHNKRRLVRALEIILLTKKPVPDSESSLSHSSEYSILKIGIVLPREKLKMRIASRLKKRLQQGMLKEVKRLHQSGVSWKRLDSFGLEYRFTSRHLRGAISKDEMVHSLEKEIWLYAKRQMTWFKRDSDIRWISKPQQARPIVKIFLR